MRVKILSLCVLAISAMGPLATWGQERPADRIKSRLAEVREMADQERRMINLLENQLGQAQTAENQDQVSRLRDEIADARARLEDFRKLESDLEELETALKAPVAFGRNRAKSLARSSASPEDPNTPDDVAAAGGLPPILQRPRPNEAPPASGRIDNLRQALRHLEAAGEVEIARRVERLIQQEQALDHDAIGIAPGGRAVAPPRSVPPKSESDQLRDMQSVLQKLQQEIEQLRGQMKDLKDK